MITRKVSTPVGKTILRPSNGPPTNSVSVMSECLSRLAAAAQFWTTLTFNGSALPTSTDVRTDVVDLDGATGDLEVTGHPVGNPDPVGQLQPLFVVAVILSVFVGDNLVDAFTETSQT